MNDAREILHDMTLTDDERLVRLRELFEENADLFMPCDSSGCKEEPVWCDDHRVGDCAGCDNQAQYCSFDCASMDA